MRLIDADAAKEAIHKEFDECLVWDESGEHTANVIEEILEAMPTVEAIPIEFIMRKCEILREMQLTCSDFDDESLWKSYMDEEHYLNLLMMTWGKREEE